MRLSSALSAAMAAIAVDTKINWASSFCSVMNGAARRLAGKRDAASGSDPWSTGTTFLDAAMGPFSYDGLTGRIYFGKLNDVTTKTATALSSGASVVRVTSSADATRWVEFTYGLSGAGTDLTVPANQLTTGGVGIAAGCYILPPASLPLGGSGLLATMTIANTSGSTVATDFIPPMFGHPFKKGDIPTGSYPKFETASAIACPYTMFGVARWSDGSLKFASFLIRVPTTVAGSGTIPISVKSTTTAPATSARTLADLSSGSLDLNVTAVGMDNLAGTWVSSLNQGIADADDIMVHGDGAVGKVWRIRQQFMQSATNHGQLECYWYVAALQNAAGGLYGVRYLGRVAQPWYDVDTPVKTHRSFSSLTLKNGATTVRDTFSGHTALPLTYGGSGAYTGATAHGIETGYLVRVAGTTIPTGLSVNTSYFAYRADANTLGFAADSGGVVNGPDIALSGTASGDATVRAYPWIVPFGSIYTAGASGKWDYIQAGGTVAADATVRLSHDKSYWKNSGVIPAYEQATVPLAQAAFSYEPNTMGPAMRANGSAGERSDLGLLPSWHTRHILSQNANDEQVVRVTGLTLGHLPIHLQNSTTKTVPVVNGGTYSAMPAANSAFRWRGGSSTNGFTQPSGKTNPGWGNFDFDHMPCFAYYPYVLTGEPQFLDLMIEMANHAIQHRYPVTGTSTTNDIAYARNGTTNGVAYTGTAIGDGDSLREDAWSLRDLGVLVGVLPVAPVQCASYPTYFGDMLEATFAKANAYQDSIAPAYMRNNGLMHYQQNAGAHICDAWMLGYMTMALAQTVKMTGSAAGQALLNAIVKWPAHVYGSFGVWHVPHFECLVRTAGTNGAPIISSDTQLYFYGFNSYTWSSSTNLFTFPTQGGGWVPANGDRIMFDNGVVGAPPSGLVGFTPYFIVNVTSTTMQLAATAGGTPLALGNSGSGGSAFIQVVTPPATNTIAGDPGQGGWGSGYVANIMGSLKLAKAAGATVDQAMLDALQARAAAFGYNYADEPKYSFADNY